MNDGLDRLREAWLTAADDLGIRVSVDPLLARAARVFTAPVFVPDFGSRKGVIVWPNRDELRSEQRIAADLGYYTSFLFPQYETYERDLFIETLNDWGWYGRGSSPAWYTGRAWGT